jgi:hypothetical protein
MGVIGKFFISSNTSLTIHTFFDNPISINKEIHHQINDLTNQQP